MNRDEEARPTAGQLLELPFLRDAMKYKEEFTETIKKFVEEDAI